MNKKTLLLIVLGILLLVSIINFSTGTTIIINGKQNTSPVGYNGYRSPSNTEITGKAIPEPLY